ncbi:MAG: amidohydrolase [Flavobacteriales bacterium]|nr:amidohydrolase [Bacteroidota bacterium]MCB9241165.1 amidohydrolase [Flavobacteriales bacterium]
MSLQHIQQRSDELFESIVAFRRDMHRNPELSFHEVETQERIRTFLTAHDMESTVCAETGLVVLIKGKNPEKAVVALRADIDALPIREANQTDYCSINDGVMHACGHDVHTSSLLGCAVILNELKDAFEGTFKLIFQPGEEKLPGGASIMIREGVLTNPDVHSMIGQHVMPLIDAGKVGFRSGLYMASADEIYITVHGKGGHAAHPHQTIDPVSVSAHIITALQTIVSRSAKPSIPSVLSIGKIIGNGATNVIPNEVYMEGTFRTFDENWRAEAHQLIEKNVNGIAQSLGARADVEVRKGYPYLENNPEVTHRARQCAVEYLGEENVVDLDIWPAGEDFAFYSQLVPSTFYRLGTRNESMGITSMLHTPTFDVDERCLRIGPGLMAYTAIQELAFRCES